MPKRILITGAVGFIGSHFVEEVIQATDWEIVALIRLDNVGDMERITSSLHNQANGSRIKIVYHDLKGEINESVDERIGHIDYVCHLAANSHVDRSITHPKEFFEDNVMGTVNLLEWARKRNKGENKISLFLNFGTDEVFGPAPDGYDFKEDDRWRPSNPYSGSKAGQTAAGYSYWITYKLPVISTHMMNVFGERQHPEKLVPKTIKQVSEGKPMPIHCKLENGKPTEIGQRHWLHARNAAHATLFIIRNGKIGEFYNIVGDTELDNLEFCNLVADIVGKPLIPDFVDFHNTRPGHDRRYALDGTKLKNLGWKPPVDFKESLKRTVNWYIENPSWLNGQ